MSTKRVTISTEPDDKDSGEIITEFDYTTFIHWASGHVLIKIGEGKFADAMTRVIDLAMRKGRYNFHQQLLKKNE